MFSFAFCNLDFVEDDGSRVAVLLLLGLFGRVNEWPAQLSVSVRVGEVLGGGLLNTKGGSINIAYIGRTIGC